MKASEQISVTKADTKPELNQPGAVPMSEWGKDHWSTFAYLDSRIIDYGGVPDRDHMRCDPAVHPGLTNRANQSLPGPPHPTMLKGYFVKNTNGIGHSVDKSRSKAGHDDWSCLDDFESAGLMINIGTGVNPVVKMTPLGEKVADMLRSHKRRGGVFAFFEPQL